MASLNKKKFARSAMIIEDGKTLIDESSDDLARDDDHMIFIDGQWIVDINAVIKGLNEKIQNYVDAN